MRFGLGLGLGALKNAAAALFNNAPFVWRGSRVWRGNNIWRN
jgi:hypothetical protein